MNKPKLITMIGVYSDRGRIYFNFRSQKNGKRISLKYYPGISDEGLNPETKKFKDQEIQKKITGIENAIFKVTEANDPFNLTNDSFTRLINEYISGKSLKQTPFFEYCDNYYQSTLLRYEKISMRSIQTTINVLRKYDPKLTFEKIDRVFYRGFMQHLRDLNLSLNYTGLHIKNLKRILNHATDSGVNTNLTFRDFKKPAENVFNVYLDDKEIEAIYTLTIDELAVMQLQKENSVLSRMTIDRQIVALEKARKLFIIGCCTGLRAENYLSIDPNIQIDLEGGFIHAISNKGGAKLKIPLHRYVKEIYTSGGWPETLSQQKLNDSIKKLGRLASIEETVSFTRSEGNSIKQYSKPKYKLITSHTARRSFCSNLYQKGVPTQYIMAISGHKSESTFKKYIQQVKKDIMTEKLKDYDVWG